MAYGLKACSCHPLSVLVWLVPPYTHYVIMTLKLTLKIYLTLKKHGNHTKKGNHIDNHTEIF